MKNICKECNFTFVKKPKVNGNYLVRKQCFYCGCLDNKVYKFSDVGIRSDVMKLPDFDEALNEKYFEVLRKKRLEEYKKNREESKNEFFKEYSIYLKSEKWNLKREKVLQRDSHLCQACLNRRATQVHHLSYEFVYDEPLFDLTSVCTECHNKIHDLRDKQNKYEY